MSLHSKPSFQLIKELGRGAVATVYLALDSTTSFVTCFCLGPESH